MPAFQLIMHSHKDVSACNYRPISLTCVPSKITERVIAVQMYEHFKANSLLNSAQYGFYRG